MIGLDTNVLIRHLTQDDARQSRIASDILEHRLTPERPGYISIVTMVEFAWVLESRFDLSREEIAAIIDGLVQLQHVVVQNRGHVLLALDELRTGRADFSDVLVGALCADAGCTITMTFDRRASKLPGFQLAT